MIALTATTSVLLKASAPIMLVNGAGLDDGLFLRLANSLSDGRWLGPFDTLTLVKGPAYPMFIAFTHLIGVPLKVGEQLTLLLAALALAACLWCISRRPVVATAAFVVIALQPASFSAADSRVLRGGWYASLSLLVVTAFFLAVHLAVTRGARWLPLVIGTFTGLVGGLFWLCREEGVWLLPSLLLIAVVPVCARFLARRGGEGGLDLRSRRLWVRAGGVVAVLGVTGASALLVIGSVLVENHREYGVALVNDASTGAIPRAYADWADVEAGQERPFVPISAAQRAAVYAVSPAARELRPYLEDPKNYWLTPGCRIMKICDDFAGGWEIWALREAAAKAGHFGSEGAAQRYFGRISHQIVAACSDGRLRCLPRLPTSLEPLQHARPVPLLRATAKGLNFLLTSSWISDPPGPARPVPVPVRRSFAAMVDGVPQTEAGAHQQLRAFRDDPVYRWLRVGYRVVIPALFVLGLVGCVASVAFRRGRGPGRRRGKGLGVLAAALAVGVVTRLVVLAVFDTTSFHTILSPGYQFATQFLLLAFGVVGTAQLVDVLLDRRSGSPTVVELTVAELTVAEPPRPEQVSGDRHLGVLRYRAEPESPWRHNNPGLHLEDVRSAQVGAGRPEGAGGPEAAASAARHETGGDRSGTG